MCHAQIMGSSLVAARRAFRCGLCEEVVPAGEEHVRHSMESLEEERDSGDPRTAVWRLCTRCAVRWDALWKSNPWMDGCPTEPEDFLRENARNVGVSGMRAAYAKARAWLRGLRR